MQLKEWGLLFITISELFRHLDWKFVLFNWFSYNWVCQICNKASAFAPYYYYNYYSNISSLLTMRMLLIFWVLFNHDKILSVQFIFDFKPVFRSMHIKINQVLLADDFSYTETCSWGLQELIHSLRRKLARVICFHLFHISGTDCIPLPELTDGQVT